MIDVTNGIRVVRDGEGDLWITEAGSDYFSAVESDSIPLNEIGRDFSGATDLGIFKVDRLSQMAKHECVKVDGVIYVKSDFVWYGTDNSSYDVGQEFIDNVIEGSKEIEVLA